LSYGNSSIKEIAFELGFDESTNFIKYIKKHIGSTPAEFRERFISKNIS
jgi:AraC family transcriptional activator of pobA